jgi:hypothetical protein
MTTAEVEVAVANYFGVRQNMIVTNVKWGLGFEHELDVLVLTKSSYAHEIELKISKQDLMRDFQKKHNHESNKIKSLYYAMPVEMEGCADIIPSHAGILIAEWREVWEWHSGKQIFIGNKLDCRKIREPRINKNANKLTDKEVLHLGKLASMRIWRMKKNRLKEMGVETL